MIPFDKEQALIRHIHLSDLHEEEKKELIAEGRHSNVATGLNLALGELEDEALRSGFVFRCWEPVEGQGFTHTIVSTDSSPAHIFVATRQTQGQRENDFCFVPEGEIVTLPVITCDREEVDGHCGCHRSLCGVHSSKATTTMKVAVFTGGRGAFEKAIRSSLRRDGYSQRGAEEMATKIIRSAMRFPEGTVVEYRDGIFDRRFP